MRPRQHDDRSGYLQGYMIVQITLQMIARPNSSS